MKYIAVERAFFGSPDSFESLLVRNTMPLHRFRRRFGRILCHRPISTVVLRSIDALDWLLPRVGYGSTSSRQQTGRVRVDRYGVARVRNNNNSSPSSPAAGSVLIYIRPQPGVTQAMLNGMRSRGPRFDLGGLRSSVQDTTHTMRNRPVTPETRRGIEPVVAGRHGRLVDYSSSF
jgi:hypothetical protein